MASIQLATAADKDAATAQIAALDAVWCAGIDAHDAWIAARDAVVAKNQSEWRDRVAAIVLTSDAVPEDYDDAAKHEDFSNKGKYDDEEERTEPFDYEKAMAVWTERCREASTKDYGNKAVHERYGMDGYTRGDEREDDYDYDYDDDC